MLRYHSSTATRSKFGSVGNGVEKNLKLAADYFKQAAHQWHPQGQERWGTLLWTGCGADMRSDKEQAVKQFKQAALKGIPGALYGIPATKHTQ